MKCGIAIWALVAVWLALSSEVSAQDTATSLNEVLLSGSLQRGDGVYVTDTTGQRIKGAVSNATSTALTVTRGPETWTLTVPEIAKIERQDPIWTGAAAGAGIGYGAVFAYCLSVGGGDCFVGVGVYAYPFVAASAALGVLWDFSMHKTLYEAPGDSRVTVAPMMGDEGLGAQLSVSW